MKDFLLTDLWDDENIKIYQQPELPKITIKKGKVEYTIPNLRLLNESAIRTLAYVINTIIDDEKINDVIIELADNVDENKLQIVTDILLGLVYTYKKRGSFGDGHFLILGFKRIGNKMTVLIDKDHAKYIREYFKEHRRDMSFPDMVVYVIQRDMQRWVNAPQLFWSIPKFEEYKCPKRK